MTGPFVDILKNVAVNRLPVSFVEIALRAISIRTAVARYSFTRSSEWVSIPHLFFRTFVRSGSSDVMG